MRIHCVIRVLIASLFTSSIDFVGAHGGTMSSTQTSFKRKPWLAPAVFVPGVGGKTVRSRRVTEQWNRKRAARKKGRQRAQREYKGNERGEEEKGRERKRKRERERERERERQKEKEKIVIFLGVQFFVFYFLRMTAFHCATRANGDVYARGKRAAIKPADKRNIKMPLMEKWENNIRLTYIIIIM